VYTGRNEITGADLNAVNFGSTVLYGADFKIVIYKMPFLYGVKVRVVWKTLIYGKGPDLWE
jgi:hypothetical protein